MIEISLLDFIRTGALGPVHLGMADSQVRRELGEPEGESLRKVEEPWIPYFCKYGNIDLYYEQEREELVSIHVEPRPVPVGTAQMTLDPWIIRRGMPIEEVEAALRAEGVPCARLPYRGIPNIALLVTEAGVEIGFYLVREMYTVPAGLNFLLKSDLYTNQ